MPKLRVRDPLWLDGRSGQRARHYPRLREDLSVDVAIVEGGITGAAVAWLFASHGVRVAVLEKARVGRGSTALLMQEPDTDFTDLVNRYGSKNAKRIWRRSQAATRECIRTLKTLDIRCQLEERDSIYYALRKAAGRRLRDEWRRRGRAGLPARWLDAAALLRVAGLRGAAAIRMPGNAQVDPCLACMGLLRAAREHGARIFEHRSSGAGPGDKRLGVIAVVSARPLSWQFAPSRVSSVLHPRGQRSLRLS